MLVNFVRNDAFSRCAFGATIVFVLLLAQGSSCLWAQSSAAAGPGDQASSPSPGAANAQPPKGKGGAAGATSPANPAPAAKAAPVIDPQVREVLNRACRTLSSAKTATYHAEINFDSVLPSHIKLQYAAELDAAIERPNRLAISYKSDLGAKQIWYNGKTLTILDPAHRAYAIVPAADSIDQMLAQMAEEKNLSMPLENLNLNDPCKRAYRDVLRGKYVGVNDVGGVACDHLAFIQQETDWQLWVDHGKTALPRKIVITYKKLPAQPQWEAVLSDWRFNRKLPASLFQAKIPKGMIKTSFIGAQEKQQ
jgi:hypothetical protein